MVRVKLTIVITLLITMLSTLFSPTIALADYNGNDSPPITITVIVPRDEVQPIPSYKPNPRHIYPVHVWESRDSERRQIIRVYELGANESPAYIPRETFERDGFRFELAEIVRREMPVHSVREHEESISISTQTNDLATVLRLLSPTMEHVSDDGYFGVLSLDISSIDIVSDGTRTTSHTATTTREFPHLSSPDTSLVPRTVTDDGRTYNLVNVEWRSQSSTAIDYTQVTTTFTAVATYSRNATRSSTIGYTTTATYRGQVSRVAVGRTEFTAYFIGIPIVAPVTNTSTPNVELEYTAKTKPVTTESATVESVVVEQVHIGGIVVEVEQSTQLTIDTDADNEVLVYTEVNRLPIGNIIIGLLFISGLVIAYFVGKKGKDILQIINKPACFIFICALVLSVPQDVYALELPQYGFGIRGNASSAHFNRNDAQPNISSSATINFSPSHTTNPSGISQPMITIHFDPSRTDIAISGISSFATHFHPYHANMNNYNYGEIIGTLTVERLGRTINVIAGATMSAMDFGAGHFSFTGLNQGNTGLIGHNRGRSNGFFSFVRGLNEGDVLTLEAGGIVRRYAVAMLYIVDETDFSPLMQFGDTRLTLVTCVEYQRSQRRIAVAFALD